MNNPKTRRSAVLLLVCASLAAGIFAAACGSSDSSSGTPATADASTGTDAAVGTDASSPASDASLPVSVALPDVAVVDAANDSSADAGALLAPLLDLMQSTDAGVKVGWVNNTTDCTSVRGERKYGLVSYTEVFSVAGSATNTVDTSSSAIANPSSTQCTYRVRCERGGAYSPYSNELSTFCMP